MAKFISLDNIKAFYTKLKSLFTKNSLVKLDGTITGNSFTFNNGSDSTSVTGVYFSWALSCLIGKVGDNSYVKVFKDYEFYGTKDSEKMIRPRTDCTYIVNNILYKYYSSTLTVIGQVVSPYEKDTISSLSSALYEDNKGVIPASNIGEFKEINSVPYLQVDILSFENADTGYETDTSIVKIPIANNNQYGFTKLNVYNSYSLMPKLTATDVGTMYWSKGENKPYWWTGSAWRSF